MDRRWTSHAARCHSYVDRRKINALVSGHEVRVEISKSNRPASRYLWTRVNPPPCPPPLFLNLFEIEERRTADRSLRKNAPFFFAPPLRRTANPRNPPSRRATAARTTTRRVANPTKGTCPIRANNIPTALSALYARVGNVSLTGRARDDGPGRIDEQPALDKIILKVGTTRSGLLSP